MTVRRGAPVVASMLSLALLVAACGGSSSGDLGPAPTRDPVPTTSTEAPDPLLPPAQSSSTVSVGRDGPLLGELIETIPDAGIHPLMTGAFAAVNRAADECQNLEAFTEHLDTAVTRFENLLPRVQSSPDLAEWRGSIDAKRLSDEIRDRLVRQVRCDGGAVNATDAQILAATSVTGRAVAVSDWYRLRLYEAPASIGAEMWYHADHLGHVVELERLRSDDQEIGVLVVGDSRVKRGVDALALSGSLGTTAMNIGMPLLYPTVMEPWLDQARRRARQPARVVIGVGATDAFRACTDARIARMEAAVALQEQAFATLPVLAELDREPVLVGAGPTSSYGDSPVLRAHRTTTLAEGQGTGITGTASEVVAVEVERGQYRSLLTDPVRCDPIIDTLGRVVETLVADGVDVLVVGMPIHPELRDMPPTGGELIDGVTVEQSRLAQEAGATFLDLSQLLSAEEFVDLTDPTEAGRARVTESIAAALGG
ncbi:MAG: hypothetical protein OES57_03685 [Acidimicrobiia bacterium]|nr:hypothetical protein [Acidimicrobiia bacterium]